MHTRSNPYNLKHIIAHFKTEGKEFEFIEFGSGHINDTFLVKCKSGIYPAYLLQKINTFVFRNIDGLMNNMLHVTNHLKKRLQIIAETPKKKC